MHLFSTWELLLSTSVIHEVEIGFPWKAHTSCACELTLKENVFNGTMTKKQFFGQDIVKHREKKSYWKIKKPNYDIESWDLKHYK